MSYKSFQDCFDEPKIYLVHAENHSSIKEIIQICQDMLVTIFDWAQKFNIYGP